MVAKRQQHQAKHIAEPKSVQSKKPKRQVVNPLGQVFTTAQVGDMLQVSIATIQRAIRAGDLKAHRVGRVYRVNEADMRAWWEALSTLSTLESHDS
jgi:excisionase family DNA binding protein